jgi:hypothetical protein
MTLLIQLQVSSAKVLEPPTSGETLNPATPRSGAKANRHLRCSFLNFAGFCNLHRNCYYPAHLGFEAEQWAGFAT